MDNSMTVKFWGVRGSHPVPGRTTVRYGGNTPAVEVRAGQQTIILDAGTGIIGLGRELARRSRENGTAIEATLLFSHLHHDHTQGFPFFTPAYNPASRLHIFGPGLCEHDLEDTLSQTMLPPIFPISLPEMNAVKVIRSLRENEVVLLGAAVGGMAIRKAGEPMPESDELVRIRALRSYAHPNGVFIYRIEWRGRSLVYATDTEGYANTDQRLANFARGADLLIHDAQYTDEHYLGLATAPSTQGWGHSTAAMAADVARAAAVAELALFHYDPTYDDDKVARIERQAREGFANTLAAYEGLTITLGEQAVTTEPITEARAA